jgi:NADH:ubiquinone oxidoreductase subunit 3 (subunit A)
MTDKQKNLISLVIMVGILWAMFRVGMSINQTENLECTDYTLNQYEAGDVPVKCIDLFLEENK